MNNQKGFANIVLIVLVVVLAGAVGYFALVKKSPEVSQQTNTPTPINNEQNNQTSPKPTNNTQTTPPTPQQPAWKTYRADKYGVSFSYPPNFQIITDKIQIEYIGHPKGFNWYRIELADSSAPEKPFMRFEIDPDGYGPFFPDKTYQVTESSTGKVVINSVNDSGSENSNDGKVLIIPNVLEVSNGHSYYWQFSFNESGKDYEPMFKQILSTFQFTK